MVCAMGAFDGGPGFYRRPPAHWNVALAERVGKGCAVWIGVDFRCWVSDLIFELEVDGAGARGYHGLDDTDG
mgnify:CR=1 FL=1